VKVTPITEVQAALAGHSEILIATCSILAVPGNPSFRRSSCPSWMSLDSKVTTSASLVKRHALDACRFAGDRTEIGGGPGSEGRASQPASDPVSRASEQPGASRVER
jgi:hypothetical protein